MRVTFSFTFKNKIVLPVNYNYQLQSFFYKLFDKKIANFLHNKGYRYGSRSFKLFTFSSISGKSIYDARNKILIFSPPIKILFSTPIDDIICSLSRNIIINEKFNLAGNEIFIESISVHKKIENFKDKIIIKTLSPITIYSTFLNSMKKKKTYYYSPTEDEFSKLIYENARKKYEILKTHKSDEYNQENENLNLTIKPIKCNPKKHMKVVKYKNFLIKAWHGIFELSGSPELIKTVYYTGIGSKNPQGFGCVEVIGKSLLSYD